MKRLVLTSSSLKISTAGVDASSAADNGGNFIFNSANRCYFGVFASGSVAWSTLLNSHQTSTTSGGNTSISAYYDVMFGKTFAAPPPVIGCWDSQSFIPAPFTGSGRIGGQFAMMEYLNGGYMASSLISMVDRLRITLGVFINGGYGPNNFTYVNYIVGQS